MIKKIIKKIIIKFIYAWGTLFYDKKYLQGRCFDKENLTEGWFWILRCWYPQHIKGINSHVPWPVSENVLVGDPNNIEFDIDYMRNFFSCGCYYQALGAKLHIGKRTMIAPGVGLITGNHTVVGAGAVVTKSVPDGYCILAGNPAKVIRKLIVNNEGKSESIRNDCD